MKIAMIGSYAHVGQVLGALKTVKDVQVVAACPYGPADKLSFIGKDPATPAGLKVYDDPRRMLDEQRPDLVSVYAPMHQIAGYCITALQAGCHVVAEKPLATTLEDLQRVASAASAAGREIIASLGTRGAPSYQAARQAVQAGRIGRPVLAMAQKSYPGATPRGPEYLSRQTYGGSIPWQAIHAIDFVSYCANLDYVRAAAMHANVCHPQYPGMEDSGGVLLEFAGGGHAVIAFDYLRPFEKATGRAWGDDRMRLVGSDAIVEVHAESSRVTLMTPSAVEELPMAPARSTVAEFIEHLRTGSECLLTMAESLRATEVALKARQAADEGRVVEL